MFKQEELVAGKHVVITRDGSTYLVVNYCNPANEWHEEENNLFLLSENGYCNFEYKNFKYRGSNGAQPKLDIVEVYQITSPSNCLANPKWQTLLWAEGVTEKVKQQILQLEQDIENRDYHNSRSVDKISELKLLIKES